MGNNVRSLDAYRREHNVTPPEIVRSQVVQLATRLGLYGFDMDRQLSAAESLAPILNSPLQDKNFRKDVEREIKGEQAAAIRSSIELSLDQDVPGQTMDDISYLWGVSKVAASTILARHMGAIGRREEALFGDDWYVTLLGLIETIDPTKRQVLGERILSLGTREPGYCKIIEPARYVHGIAKWELEQTLHETLGLGFMESQSLSEQMRQVLRQRLIEHLEGYQGPLTPELANRFARALPFVDTRYIQPYTRSVL